ncbi:hypothetical protein D7I39_21755 [Allopusillimonas ginsengisoli]|nr:hypothetical protein D7I39_21755 [Allopusillimonas ginsengisoli]
MKLSPLTHGLLFVLLYGKNTVYNNSIMTMLTYHQLKAIQDENSRNADIMELLREIKRLRGLIVDAYVFTGVIVLENRTPELSEAHRHLRESMSAEPCIAEYQRMEESRKRIEYTRRAAMLSDKRARNSDPD